MINEFIQKSGFKVLAVAKLTEFEYRIVLYLMNCVVTGLKEIITTSKDLCSVLNLEEDQLQIALIHLRTKKILKFKTNSHSSDMNSICIGLEIDVDVWNLDDGSCITVKDAVVYPFTRNNKAVLEVVEKSEKKEQEVSKNQSVEVLLNIFWSFVPRNQKEKIQDEKDIQVLMQTHPTPMIELFLNHFQERIKSFHFLLSSWQHYQEIFETETQKIDFVEAKIRHYNMDQSIIKSASELLIQKISKSLTSDEIQILELIKNHKFPRRQLFWAYKARDRYKNLKDFFHKNKKNMLPVTTSGTIVKKPLQD